MTRFSFASQTNRLWVLLLVGITAVTAVMAVFFLPSVAASTAGAQAAVQADHVFHADLSGDNEVPPVDTDASGRVVLALEGDTLYYRLLASDIISVTQAHIHDGLPGVNGPVLHWLYDPSGVNAPGGPLPVSGSFTVTQEVADDLLAGNLYVNVHTEANTGGEIRGQIEEFTPLPDEFLAVLTPGQEAHEVESDAEGVARFTLVTTDTLDFEMAVTDIVSITQSHIHTGWPGEAGPVVHWLYDPSGVNAPGGPFGPGEPISGTVTLAAADLVDLLTGYYYVNVHTEAYGAGEIRGQIGPGLELFSPIVFQEPNPAE